MSFTTSDIATAADHLRTARRRLEEATATLRLAAALDWAAPGGDAFREESGALLTTLDADGAALVLAAMVAAGCEPS
ncbi:hypothetical protein [Isoptericola dokdonensis]|uniref:Uncharacterized protein n=1 Tax=Isoptericola dokdonensis DS-3 TaxID=1300344 RepID=A0A161I2C1_9MICO|nr:hypothetical protein [Isoptericola dokdonensis]ANC31725.1 hypothetical protein I598_2184 [Isoptericola dokdonensis DS-3]